MLNSTATNQKQVHVLNQNKAFACEQCSAAKICLPTGLNKDELNKLENIIQRRKTIHQHEHLFRSGDPLYSIFALRSGSIKIYTTDNDGKNNVLGFFFPGEMIGLEAVFSNKHNCNAIALETSNVCCIPFESLSQLASSLPRLQQQLFRVMSKELVFEYAIAGDYTAEERFAAFLLMLSQRFKQRGYSELEFQLSMPRNDIAGYLRLAPETISRLFKRFQEKRWIEVSRRETKIINIMALKKIAKSAICF